MKSDLHLKVEQFPTVPGVYLMKNEKGEILYVGKAKNLRSRVLSYFSEEKDGRYQVQFLMRKVFEVESIVTSNEKEALLLENTLIKKHKPRYNIFLKDDKSYLSLKLNVKHPFPRLTATRRIEKDGSLYFGPYTSGFEARKVLDFVEEHFRVRNCSEHDFSNRARPCLQYQIKRCDAPCVGYISQEAYAETLEQAKLFLQGRGRELLPVVAEKMEKAAEALHFEQAARLRDLSQAIRKTLEKQKVVSHFGGDADVVALAREGERVAIGLLLYREGDLGERKHYLFKTPQEDEEVLESFLLQYYAASPVVPREILVPFFWEGLKPLEEILSEKRGGPVSLKVPEKGEKSAKVELARQNVQERLRHEVLTEESREEILTQLQSKLGLNRLPRRMECYDISNIQGQMAVGSCVSFLDGVPDKSAYRRFKIKTVPQANDFAMLYEVLSRRFSRGDWPTPDLIVIDGGKGQLHAAEAALKDKNVIHVDLISLAKEKAYPGDDKRRKFFEPAPKRPERVFLPGRKNPVVLHPNSSALHVLVRIRDEAHRFGITYHRKLRSRRALHSTLDGIEGVGPGRKKELLRHFGSLKKIQTAPAEEIGRVKGISLSLAEKIVQHFQSQKN